MSSSGSSMLLFVPYTSLLVLNDSMQLKLGTKKRRRRRRR
jgi:hypothetical protein